MTNKMNFTSNQWFLVGLTSNAAAAFVVGWVLVATTQPLGFAMLLGSIFVIGSVWPFYKSKQVLAAEKLDAHALVQLQAQQWNNAHRKGVAVAYEKSPLEGRVILKTTSNAYVLGDEAVVDLEYLGVAMLSKIQLAP